MAETKTYVAIVELPNCRPTFRQGQFLQPGKYRITVKIDKNKDKMVVAIIFKVLSSKTPALEELARDIKWVLEHLKGYCTEPV